MNASDPADPADTFDAVYARELPYVYRTLGRLGVPPSEVPDAVHDVFVVVYRRWAEVEPGRPLRPWLFGIARRLAAGWRRKRREVPQDDLELVGAAAPPHPERDLVWRALGTLDSDRRDVVVLHDLDGFTAPEIADIVGAPVPTVYSRLRAGRAELVAALRALGAVP